MFHPVFSLGSVTSLLLTESATVIAAAVPTTILNFFELDVTVEHDQPQLGVFQLNVALWLVADDAISFVFDVNVRSDGYALMQNVPFDDHL